jgi:hypothetical protein
VFVTTARVLLVAEAGATQMGGHLMEAASALGIASAVCDSREAYAGSALRRRLFWRLAGHRPPRLVTFSAKVLRQVREFRPTVLLATGLAPVDAPTLQAIGAEGVRRINFLTDDPWNRAHRAPWFLAALPHYDHVWSPRQANLNDLRRAKIRRVDYLPFGYNPAVHRYDPPASESEERALATDVLVVGGADAERVVLVRPLLRSGIDVALYGGYWDRYYATRRHARGPIDAEGMRKATASARVCLGLVRRANRDGHSMRTFEIPAMRGCLLAERTTDHERLFGREGEAVLYFQTAEEALRKTRWLLGHADERARLARAAHALVTGGGHSYRDRLSVMLGLSGS